MTKMSKILAMIENLDEKEKAEIKRIIKGNKPKMKTVTNLMSGKKIRIPENTPRSCDPSTELYWTM
jgi:hypothetical protein